MPTLAIPAAVIFDMDGLIFDSEALYEEALVTLAQQQGLTGFDSPFARQFVGLSWPDTKDLLRGRLPRQHDVGVFIEGWKSAYQVLAETHLTLKPGVTELLDHLQQLAVPCAVATGTGRDTALAHLASHNMVDRFAAIITADDYPRGKPAPDAFLTAASALDVSPHTSIALEDSIHGVISAHAAGMITIMVPDRVEPDAETIARCAHVARSLLEVRDMIVG